MRTRTVLVASLFVAALPLAARAQSPQIVGQLRQVGAMFAQGQPPATPVFAGLSNEGVENPFMTTLEMGRCYTFVGVVGPGVEQLSIYLFDATGKTVAKDTTDRSVTPHLTHCARWTGLYKILGKIKRGAGEFGMQGFTYATAGAPPPVAYAPPPAAYAPPPTYAPPPPVAGSPLGAQLAGMAAQRVPGQPPQTPVLAGMLAEGQEQPFMVMLTVGRCYTFLGTVGPGVEQLSIYLFDPNGKSLVKDTTDRSIAPMINHCARWSGLYKVLGKIKRGNGQFAIQGFAP